MNLPAYTKEILIEWADKIDRRLGPIPGRDADFLACMLRATAAHIGQLMADRDDQDKALRDAISETARTADELAFWKYQAIWGRAYLLAGKDGFLKSGLPEATSVWAQAERQLEEARTEENRERHNFATEPLL